MERNRNSAVKRLTLAAMMAALSVVIGIVCKNFFTIGIYYRVTFENLPVILAGIVLGPAYGAVVGAAADVVSCVSSTNPAVNPLITLGAAAVGFTAGLVSRCKTGRPGTLRLALCVAFSHLIGQVIIKSIAKMIWFGMPWWGSFIGLGISALVGTVEFFAIKLLLNRSGVLKDMMR